MNHYMRSFALLALCALFAGLSVMGSGAQTDPLPALKAALLADLRPALRPATPAVRDLLGQPDSPALVAAGMADWSRMAYESYRDGNWEIYLAHGDGAAEVRLTTHPAMDIQPRLNRGADRITFASDRDGNLEIYRLNIDGSGLARLTNHPGSDSSPMWSPDGGQIVFSSNRTGNWEIYVMNADGLNLRPLTQDGAPDVTPAWSPDGSRIAWVRNGERNNTLWVMNADGTGARAIIPALPYLENPAWSPDGMRLAFDYDCDGDYWNEISTITADGSALYCFTNAYYDAYVDAWMGSWSPDGQWLRFSRVEYVVYQNQLYISGAYIEQISAYQGAVQRVGYQGLEMNPDWQTSDVSAPVSRVGALPAFTRATDVTVQWGGVDRDGSGIASYDVQYRSSAEGAWTDWQALTTATSAPFTGEPGATVYFRSRARDRAYNVEPWPTSPDGHTATNLYLWAVQGMVRDLRDRPIPAAALSATPATWFPAASRSDGSYLGYATATAQTLSASKTGYAAAPAALLALNADSAHVHLLGPQDNRIQNGGFESGSLAGWQVGGRGAHAVTALAAHSGAFGLRFGEQPLPVTPVNISQSSSADMSALAYDSSGNVHLAWRDTREPWRIVYTTCPPAGACTPPQDLGQGLQPELATGPDGRVHLVYARKADPSGYTFDVVYRERGAAGAWSPPQVISPGPTSLYGGPDLAVDAAGVPHVLWGANHGGQILYSYRLAAGTWAAPVTVPEARVLASLAVTDDGRAHVAWGPGGEVAVGYIVRQPDGTWGQARTLPAPNYNPYGVKPELAVDASDTAHIVWFDWTAPGALKYVSVTQAGEWSTSEMIPGMRAGSASSDEYQVGIAPGDRLVVTTLGQYLVYRNPDGTWSDVQTLFQNEHTNGIYTSMAFQPGTNRVGLAVCFAEPTGQYPAPHDVFLSRFELQVEAAVQLTVNQPLHVPADLHQPTVALLQRRSVPDTAESDRLTVAVADAAGQTTPLSAAVAGAPDWSLAWFDMTPWLGQSVTLTLGFETTADGRFTQVDVDEIVLGSWLTPVITGVSQAHIEAFTATAVTVSGANFIRSGADPGGLPALQLNGVAIPAVQWHDDATLTALLPPLSPGNYSVWITNPGGQQAVLPSSLQVGRPTYLPLVSH